MGNLTRKTSISLTSWSMSLLNSLLSILHSPSFMRHIVRTASSFSYFLQFSSIQSLYFRFSCIFILCNLYAFLWPSSNYSSGRTYIICFGSRSYPIRTICSNPLNCFIFNLQSIYNCPNSYLIFPFLPPRFSTKFH